MHDANGSTVGAKSPDKEELGTEASFKDAVISTEKSASASLSSYLLSPCALICCCSNKNGESADRQNIEDGMFYCSLCEVEVSDNRFQFLT